MFLGSIGLVVKSKQSEESKTQSDIYKKRMITSVTLGMAEYDPQSDSSVDDVIRHADKTMYEKKRERKNQFDR